MPEGALKAERYRAHRAVQELLDGLAVGRPLLLALDDLHWADQASLEVVASLLRRPPDGPVLLACAFRPGAGPGVPRVGDRDRGARGPRRADRPRAADARGRGRPARGDPGAQRARRGVPRLRRQSVLPRPARARRRAPARPGRRPPGRHAHARRAAVRALHAGRRDPHAAAGVAPRAGGRGRGGRAVRARRRGRDRGGRRGRGDRRAGRPARRATSCAGPTCRASSASAIRSCGARSTRTPAAAGGSPRTAGRPPRSRRAARPPPRRRTTWSTRRGAATRRRSRCCSRAAAVGRGAGARDGGALAQAAVRLVPEEGARARAARRAADGARRRAARVGPAGGLPRSRCCRRSTSCDPRTPPRRARAR